MFWNYFEVCLRLFFEDEEAAIASGYYSSLGIEVQNSVVMVPMDLGTSSHSPCELILPSQSSIVQIF